MSADLPPRPCCLLMAPNEPLLDQLLQIYLSEQHIDAIPVQSQSELLSRLRTEPVTFAIINEQRPNDDALAIAQMVREHFDVALILILETVHPDRSLRAYDLNTEYIIKPFDRDELRARIRSVLHRSNKS